LNNTKLNYDTKEIISRDEKENKVVSVDSK